MPKSNSASYIFDGWLGNDGSFYQTVEEEAEALMVRGNLELTAQWTYRPVIVRFDLNGGVAVDINTFLDREVDPYSQIDLPRTGTATKPGYELVGWTYSTDASGMQIIYNVTETSNDKFPVPRVGATLVAVWVEAGTLLTFKSEMTNTTGAGYITIAG